MKFRADLETIKEQSEHVVFNSIEFKFYVIKNSYVIYQINIFIFQGLINACIAAFSNKLPLCMRFCHKIRYKEPIVHLWKITGILETFQGYVYKY